jgi:two-component system, LytTR family, sensor kinase
MKDKGVIVVEVKQQQNDLLLEVYDNGPDFPAEPVGGYGLQNLHDTLSLLYGNKASINWVNGTNKHIAVTLKHFFES